MVNKPKRTMNPFLTRPTVPESLPCPRVEMLVYDVGGWRGRCVWHPRAEREVGAVMSSCVRIPAEGFEGRAEGVVARQSVGRGGGGEVA